VVSARSPLALGPDAFGWFHVRFTAQGPLIAAEEAEAGWKLVARFLEEVVAAYDADPARVFLAWLSAALDEQSHILQRDRAARS
jgi:phospholipase/carboxylesterase